MFRSQIRTAFYHAFPSPTHGSPLYFKGASAASFNARRPYYFSWIPSHLASSGSSRSKFSTMSTEESIEYDYINGVELSEGYEPGGYHPIMIDNLLHSRYRIVDKLGYGSYSTIWLAHDNQLKRYVAIKVNVSGWTTPGREANILRSLSSSKSPSAAIDSGDVIPTVLDEFDIQGPNGTHTCYAMAPAQGNLKDASFSRLFPIRVARALAAKLAIAVSFVHSQGFVHGDIRLHNVLVKLPAAFDELSVDQFREKYGKPETIPVRRVDRKPLSKNVPPQVVVPLYLGKKAQDFTLDDARLLTLCDFGEAFAPATEQRLGKDCHTPIAMRAPDALFEPNSLLSYSSDIWSLGATIWDILGTQCVFSDSEPLDEVVAEQIDVLGLQNFPPDWQKKWERVTPDADREFPRRPTIYREAWPSLEEAFEEFVQKYRLKREAAGSFGDEEKQAILNLMRGMLKFRPEDRLTIDEVLRSEWMVKWALPELE